MRHHVERLTYFRYSLVGLMVAVIVVMLITGIAEIVSDEEVDGADPDDYDFFACAWSRLVCTGTVLTLPCVCSLPYLDSNEYRDCNAVVWMGSSDRQVRVPAATFC